VSKANFLMLDEPTNHLDMHSCDLLIDALNKYEGSIILVSHDRYFVSKTANKIWEIVDHQVKEFKGGYEEWVAWKERMAKQQAGSQKPGARGQKSEAEPRKADDKSQKTGKAKEPVQPVAAVNLPPTAAPINKEVKKELQKQQRIFQQLEEQIAKLNIEKAELEASLSSPAVYADKNKFLEAETAYKKAVDDLSRLTTQYEQVFETIVSLEGNQ
jgi:ATP-binding cassette subfamily F protein 3